MKITLEQLVKKEKQIKSYINKSPELSRKLIEAKSFNEQKQLIIDNSSDNFIAGIINAPQYDVWTQEVVSEIISEFPEVKNEIIDKRLRLRSNKVKIKKQRREKKIVSRTGSGTVYNKSYTKWTKSEEIFIKTRSDKPISEVKKEYEELFTKRSYSSFSSKFYRLRGN